MPHLFLEKLKRSRQAAPLYSLLLYLGMTAIGRRLHERAKQFGYQLTFRFNGIGLRKDGQQLWFPVSDPGLIWALMERMEYIHSRLVFKQLRSGATADLRGLQRYRVPGTDDQLWLPSMPEMLDLFAGYFTQGRPVEGDIAFDCGAFCGELTIALARMVGPTGKVFSFEPDEKSRSLLAQNIREAGLNNVTVVAKGLWKETDTLRFVTEGLASRAFDPSEKKKTFEVPVIGFAEACRIAGGIPSFVKMDIEGAEIEAISGSLDFIAEHRIRFAIASYHLRDGAPTSVLLEPLFRKAGYQTKTGYPDHPTTWAWKD